MKNTNRVCAFLLALVMLFGTVFTWTAAAENTQTQESFTVDLSERNLIEVSVELAMQLKTCEVSIETDGTQTVLDLDSDGAGDVYLLIDNAHGIFAIGTTENADRLQRNLTKTYDAGYPFSPVIFRFTDIEEYTVSYFSEHGNLPLPQTVKANEKAVEPAALTDGYYLFEGWYATPSSAYNIQKQMPYKHKRISFLRCCYRNQELLFQWPQTQHYHDSRRSMFQW